MNKRGASVMATPWAQQAIGRDLVARIREELPPGYHFDASAQSASGPYRLALSRYRGAPSLTLVAEKVVRRGAWRECAPIAEQLLGVAVIAARETTNAR